MLLFSDVSVFSFLLFSSVSVFKQSFDHVFKYILFLFPNVSVFRFLLFLKCSCFSVFLFSSVFVFLFQINLFSDVPVFQHSCVSVSDVLFSDDPVFQCFSVPVV